VVSLFRQKSPITIALLIVLGFIVHARVFIEPVGITASSQTGVLSYLLQQFATKLHGGVITSLYMGLVFLQAFRLNFVLNDLRLFQRNAFTTAAAYLLLTAVFKEWNNLSTPLIVNTLIIWIFNMVARLYNNPHPKTLLFNIGLVTGTAIILYLPMAFILVVVLLALGIMRPFRLAEWLIMLLGLVTPFYLVLSGLFLTDRWYLVHQFLPKLQVHTLLVQKIIPFVISISIVGLVLLAGFIVWNKNNTRALIQVRRNWGVMLLLLIVMIPALFLNKNAGLETMLLCAVPASAFVSNLFLYPKKTIVSNLLFMLLLGVVVYNNWF
jgi:Family of unknown function (DUF6427)